MSRRFTVSGRGRARLSQVGLCLVLMAAFQAVQAADTITTRSDSVGQLLNQWAKEGTAAGLDGFDYENRDGQHSPLPQGLYPQLRLTNTGEGSQTGPSQQVHTRPTIGNCSMAAPPMQGGSLPRLYFMSPRTNEFLMAQYLANNLFIYPEHLDYDRGANGVNGFGDLFPVNSPALLISQGSSGSDMPFVKAFLATAAAFSPKTQETLIKNRLLMPTLQAIFRLSNRMVLTPSDYLSGKAHPPVFDSKDLDEEKMIRMAHAMTPDTIPPVPLLSVEMEPEIEAGPHFFEPPNPLPYKLATTGVQITRIVRGNQPEYGLVVNASKSGDYQQRGVRLVWRLLHGDPNLVKIQTSGRGPLARIKVRQPLPGERSTGILSHRVDIGVFALREKAVSAPAIISFFFLPNERRFYDPQGRISEIHYQTFNPDLGLPPTNSDPRWLKLMMGLILKGDGLRSQLSEQLLTAEEIGGIQRVYDKLRPAAQLLDDLRGDELRKEHVPAYEEKLGKDIAAALDEPLPGDRKLTVRIAIIATLNAIANFTDLYPTYQAELDQRANASTKASAPAEIRSEIHRLTQTGIALQDASGQFKLTRPTNQLGSGERYALRGLNLTLLSHVLYPEGLDRSTAPAWVDPRLTVWKPWRDVYRYDEKTDALTGWIRHEGGRTTWFSPDGLAMPDGPEGEKVPVRYVKNAQGLLDFELVR